MFLELGHVERLEQIIVSAQLHRLDGRLGGAVSGHEDDEQLGVNLPDAAERFQAADAAHANVHDHQVRFEPGNQLQPLLAAGRGGQLDFRRIKDAPERVLHVLFVIN